MMKRAITLLAAVFALGMMFGASSGASAHAMHGGYAGCCGPVKPVYRYHDRYKTFSENVHVPVYKTVRFERPRKVVDITHVHVTKIVNRIIDTHITKVGYIKDYFYHEQYPTYNYVTNTIPGVTTVRCVCGPYQHHCK